MPQHFKIMKFSLRGFSLIETVVVTALIVLVGVSLSVMIQYFYRTNDYVLQESAAVQSARLGLATAVQNLRESSYGDDGSYPIASAASSSVAFYADVNGDGKVDKIRYYLLNGTLYRGVTNSTGNPATYVGQPEGTTTVATYIRNTAATPIFQYYDDTGALIAAPVNVSNVASIAITILVDVDPNRSPSPYSLLGSATLRNLED
jgi:type II secretory pathway pseudopilin PulG